MSPLHFSPGSSRKSTLPMQRQNGKGVLAAVAPLAGTPVYPAAANAARSAALG